MWWSIGHINNLRRSRPQPLVPIWYWDVAGARDDVGGTIFSERALEMRPNMTFAPQNCTPGNKHCKEIFITQIPATLKLKLLKL